MGPKEITEEFVIELGSADIKRLWKQAKKSPEKRTRMIVKIPRNIKTIACDNSSNVKGPISSTKTSDE